jgi:hypothetical protein
MARRHKPSPHRVVQKQRIAVEVRPVPFKTFDCVRHLDVSSLSRAAHARFEVGRFEAGCCHRTVHAIVRKGMVTRLEVERCSGSVRLDPDLKKVVEHARKKLAGGRRGSKKLPVPVSKFLAAPKGLTIDVSFCFMICIFGWCLICCFDSEDPRSTNCSVFEDDWPVMKP